MPVTRWFIGASVACFACLLSAAAAAEEKADPKGIEFFEKKIRPALVAHCYECHSADAKNVKGGLLVDTREGIRKGGESGAAVVPGNSEESLLIEAIKYEGLEMPPEGKLPDDVIANFVKWVEMGAPDPRDGSATTVKREINVEAGRKFWAFQPPKAAPLPKVKLSAWPRSESDRFVLAAMEKKGLKPVADADSLTWLRRVWLDLVGFPPPPEEIEAFLKDDSPQTRQRVVDRLLASPQFGERWGRHWLDIARYAESTGKERNVPYPFAWRYRDWVIDAFNADTPYDRFIQEQIAGDLLPAESEAQRDRQLIATGFLALGPKSLNERNAQQYIMDEVDEQIDVVGRAILATTIGCARCHDHKFDPIPTADYYALAGIFKSTDVYAGVRRGSRSLETKALMTLAADTDAPSLQAIPAPKESKQTQKLRKELKEARQELADQIESLSKEKDKRAQLKFRKAIAAAKKRVRQIEEKLDNSPDSVPTNMAMAVQDARSPDNCRICIRGEVNDQGPEVPRGFVQVLLTTQQPEIPGRQSGRLQLARWLASRDNPLTARVMVNRVWQHLFGVGIVETVDNFGELGERPTHPELLDFLAVKFMDDGWSIKRLLRELVLSRAYGLSSAHDEHNYTIDPDNRLVWRMSRRRLDAEVIRDSILAASGQLDLNRPAGSPVMELGDGEIGREIRTPSAINMANVRSIYLPMVRGVVPEMLSVFDVADPSLVVGQREVTTVATQALYMMNSPFVMEQSQHMAQRLLNEASDEALRAVRAYRLALGRDPSDAERQRLLSFVHELEALPKEKGAKDDEARAAAWSAVCQSIFASAEFRYVY